MRGRCDACHPNAAVQGATVWDVLADASGDSMSERIAKAESLGIAWAPVRALLTLESDRRLRAR